MDPQPAPQTVSTDPGTEDRASHPRRARWAGRLGLAAFLFFLIKGLAWLCVPAALAALAMRE